MSDIEQIAAYLENEIITLDFSLELLSILVKVLAVLAATRYLLRFLNYLIDKLFSTETSDRYTKQRNTTLKTVTKSTSRYLIYFISTTIILEIIGIPTTSLLAGAGVVGLALGFGAQSLVEDIVTGFFILFENQFTVGNYIKTAGVEGVVEQVGLRVTKIKNFAGDLHIIPNGNIDQVTNLSSNASRALVDAAIDYEQDIEAAIKVLEDICDRIAKEYPEQIEEGPTVLGVQELAASSVNIRVIAIVEAMKVWQLERVLKQEIKSGFDQAGIEIPYDHLTIVKKD